MKNAIRNILVGFGGGGIVGATIWGTIHVFDIQPLLAWIIAGAVVGGFGAVSWMVIKRQSKASSAQASPIENHQDKDRGDT